MNSAFLYIYKKKRLNSQSCPQVLRSEGGHASLIAVRLFEQIAELQCHFLKYEAPENPYTGHIAFMAYWHRV